MFELIYASQEIGKSAASEGGWTWGNSPLILIFLIAICLYFMRVFYKMLIEGLPEETLINYPNSWRLDLFLIVLGIFIIVIGIIGLLYSLSMDTTVQTTGGRIHNIGLMNEKQNYLIASGIILITGVLLIIGGLLTISNRGQKSRPKELSPDIPDNSETKKCPYCAEMIKVEAKICRFCGSEQSVKF